MAGVVKLKRSISMVAGRRLWAVIDRRWMPQQEDREHRIAAKFKISALPASRRELAGDGRGGGTSAALVSQKDIRPHLVVADLPSGFGLR